MFLSEFFDLEMFRKLFMMGTRERSEESGNNVYQESEYEFLNEIHQLLVDENVLKTLSSTSVVDFKFPEELKVGQKQKTCLLHQLWLF